MPNDKGVRMADPYNFSENLEDYLEVILDLQQVNKVARSKDIAEKMGIQRGSVTGMLKNLAAKELIHYEPYGYVTLTEQGEAIAGEIKRRHTIIKDFLFRVLQVDEDQADATACRMEHVMDKGTIDSLVKLIRFMDTCPRLGKKWIDTYTRFCKEGKPEEAVCARCTKRITDG